jgi:phosphatidylglycerophosphatase A
MSRMAFPHPATWIATWFGAGLAPVAPGTVGSLAALPFAWAIDRSLGKPALALAGGLLFLVGLWASGHYAERTGIADPPEVCVDEVAAIWILLALLPMSLIGYVLGFIAFRAADILKPWPANLADRHVQGGFGIMLDDLLVVPHAWIACRLILWVVE